MNRSGSAPFVDPISVMGVRLAGGRAGRRASGWIRPENAGGRAACAGGGAWVAAAGLPGSPKPMAPESPKESPEPRRSQEPSGADGALWVVGDFEVAGAHQVSGAGGLTGDCEATGVNGSAGETVG